MTHTRKINDGLVYDSDSDINGNICNKDESVVSGDNINTILQQR